MDEQGAGEATEAGDGPVVEDPTPARRWRPVDIAGGAVAVAIVLAAVAVLAIRTDDAETATIADVTPTVVFDPGFDPGAAPGVPTGPVGEPATWVVDPDQPPASDASTFTALVSRVGCYDGQTGQVYPPTIDARPDAVIVTFTVAVAEPGAYDCPANEPVEVVVDIGEPLGDRTLLDGMCPADSTGMAVSGCGPDGVFGDGVGGPTTTTTPTTTGPSTTTGPTTTTTAPTTTTAGG